MQYTKRDIKVLKVPSGRSPYDWEYGWVIDGYYSPSPTYSERECLQQAENWLEKHNRLYK